MATVGRRAKLKARVSNEIEELMPDLVRLSEWLHAHPETAWEEFESSAKVAEALANEKFNVQHEYLGLPTAFRAEYGSGSLKIGFAAEYDALPGLGHACGHNLISAISVGAAIALARVATELDITVVVYGTPAEEGGGGKIEMLDRGAFHELNVALMAHPAPADVVSATPYAVAHNTVTFTGKSAHAAAFPTEGINAADAMVIAQVAIGLLRQQLPPSARVHGVVTHGGEAPNAIAERNVGRWYVRASDLDELREIEAKVRRCFEAGALATGCTLQIEPDSAPYSHFATQHHLEDLYETNIRRRSRTPIRHGAEARMSTASTDMANVSHVVPSIHPYVGIDSYPVSNHQPEFAARCIGPQAELAILDASIALAATAVDIAVEPEILTATQTSANTTSEI